jgi:excisionase family DNA binding protein
VQGELLLPEEAAEWLRVSRHTLRDWRYLGQGPAYVRVGQQVRYDRRDLERYRDAQRVEAARGA